MRGIPKPLPRALTKGIKRREAEAALEAAYADVDLRDGPFCRVTGRYTTPGAPDARVRREHDHIRPRSTHPDLVDDPKNIIVVCAEVHQLLHAGAIHIEGLDASKQLFFHWNRDFVKPGQEPFRLKGKRDAA